MADSQNKFDQAVWRIVSAIAYGHVRSYAQVARAAGYPRHARMVSKAMGRSQRPLPWHRVVRADRTLAFAVGGEAYKKQQALLESEGVRFAGRKIITADSGTKIDLDKLLWGPSN